MKTIIFLVSMFLVTAAEAAIYSKIAGQVQIAGVDCHLVRINLYSDMGTVDPTDDVLIHSYLTVVGDECDSLVPNPLISEENKLNSSFTEGTSIIDENKFDVRAYPNPCADEITIDFDKSSLNLNDEQLINVYLYDQHGSLIRNIKTLIQNNSLNIDTQNLQSGNYYIAISIGTTFSTIKFTKL